MIRYLFKLFAAVLLAAGLSVSANAQSDNPVVIELFTSQGCSSCPPADAMLHKLAERDDVIALALHVDYWDYIGWKDEFADPAYSTRQRAYAVVAGRRSIYTPQMIVNGQTSVVGARAMDLADAIEKHRADPKPITLNVARDGDVLRISATSEGQTGPMVVHLLRYQPERSVKILRGENAGRKLSYANVVENWRVVTEWNGRADLAVQTDATGPEPAVVLVQAAGNGPILAAARLR